MQLGSFKVGNPNCRGNISSPKGDPLPTSEGEMKTGKDAAETLSVNDKLLSQQLAERAFGLFQKLVPNEPFSLHILNIQVGFSETVPGQQSLSFKPQPRQHEVLSHEVSSQAPGAASCASGGRPGEGGKARRTRRTRRTRRRQLSTRDAVGRGVRGVRDFAGELGGDGFPGGSSQKSAAEQQICHWSHRGVVEETADTTGVCGARGARLRKEGAAMCLKDNIFKFLTDSTRYDVACSHWTIGITSPLLALAVAPSEQNRPR